MIEEMLQFLLGGLLLLAAIAWKIHDVRRGIHLVLEGSARVRAWSDLIGQVVLACLAFTVLVDPLFLEQPFSKFMHRKRSRLP